MRSIDKAKLALGFVLERKAEDPVLLDVARLTTLTDFFLILSCKSTRQVQAVSRHLKENMKEKGLIPLGVEGESEGHWVLLDYGDLVVHIFYEPLRRYYDLEGLWTEAEVIRFSNEV
jgi:ribosome-associated protein